MREQQMHISLEYTGLYQMAWDLDMAGNPTSAGSKSCQCCHFVSGFLMHSFKKLFLLHMQAEAWDYKHVRICSNCTIGMNRAFAAWFCGWIDHRAFCVLHCFAVKAPFLGTLSPSLHLVEPHITGWGWTVDSRPGHTEAHWLSLLVYLKTKARHLLSFLACFNINWKVLLHAKQQLHYVQEVGEIYQIPQKCTQMYPVPGIFPICFLNECWEPLGSLQHSPMHLCWEENPIVFTGAYFQTNINKTAVAFFYQSLLLGGYGNIVVK